MISPYVQGISFLRKVYPAGGDKIYSFLGVSVFIVYNASEVIGFTGEDIKIKKQNLCYLCSYL